MEQARNWAVAGKITLHAGFVLACCMIVATIVLYTMSHHGLHWSPQRLRLLYRALGVTADLIGINNRNLKTLAVDIATTEALAGRVPPDRVVVAESGLGTHADLARMRAAGARAFLVGESLMRQPDVRQATRRLLGLEDQG